MRDREINRLNSLLSAEGRPVKALAEDCCYKNVKQLQDDINHLQRENSVLKSRLTLCVRAPEKGSTEQDNMMIQGQKESAGCIHNRPKHTCDDHLVAFKDATKCCEEVQKELKAKEKVINDLQTELQKCKLDDKNVEVMNKISENLADRVKLQDCYMESLTKQQKVLREANRFDNPKANCENDPLQCKNGDVAMANVQREIEYMRKQLADISVFNERQQCLRQLQNDLALKDFEINSVKNKSCLSAASMLDGSNKVMSDRSSFNDFKSGHSDKLILDREHRLLTEELQRLTAERDHLKRRLDTEMDRFCVEREALNNTLDKLKGRLECVERDNRDLLAKQEPKNQAILEMQSDVKHLHGKIEMLRQENNLLEVSVCLIRILF